MSRIWIAKSGLRVLADKAHEHPGGRWEEDSMDDHYADPDEGETEDEARQYAEIISGQNRLAAHRIANKPHDPWLKPMVHSFGRLLQFIWKPATISLVWIVQLISVFWLQYRTMSADPLADLENIQQAGAGDDNYLWKVGLSVLATAVFTAWVLIVRRPKN